MPDCVQPDAPWVKCAVCDNHIKICERKIAVDGDYTCPAHPEGVQITENVWVCSQGCWELATGEAKNPEDRHSILNLGA